MNKKFLDNLKAILSDPSKLNINMLNGFVDETMAYFKELQEIMGSDDQEKKKEAMKDALEIKGQIEKQMADISKMTGLTPEQMMAFASNSSNLKESEWKIIEEARKKLLGSQKPAHEAHKPEFKIVG